MPKSDNKFIEREDYFRVLDFFQLFYMHIHGQEDMISYLLLSGLLSMGPWLECWFLNPSYSVIWVYTYKLLCISYFIALFIHYLY